MSPVSHKITEGRGGIDGREGYARTPGELVGMYSSHNKIEKGRVVTLAYGISGQPKLLDYDLKKLVTYGGVLTSFAPGTVIRVDDGVLRHELGLLCIAISVAIIMFVSLDDLQSVDTSSLEALATYMNGFCPFVLGLYVSLTLHRWWALRVSALGSVFDAVANVALLVSAMLPNPEHAIIRDLVVKWGMASIFLLVKAARGDHRDADLVEKGLLSQIEVDALQGISPDGRAMVMWCWIMRITQETFDLAQGPPPHAPKSMQVFNQCIAARNGIQTIHTYLKTQLPFAYVHLLCLLVSVNNIIVAIKCSAVFVVAFAKSDLLTMGYQLLMLLLVPVLYHGLLSISYVIQDPFGEDMLDFPIAAFVEYVAQCADAGIIAQEIFPGTPIKDDADVAQVATPTAQGEDGDVPADGWVDPDPDSMLASVDKIRDCCNAVTTEMSIIGSQVKMLHEAISFNENRRQSDAERLCETLLRQGAGSTAVPSQAKRRA